MGVELKSLMKMSVVMTEDLRNRIRRLAVADGRSDTRYAAKALEEHVAREERKSKPIPSTKEAETK